MTEIPLTKDSSNLQKTLDDFRGYYRARYPLSKGHTLPIILFHLGKLALFIVAFIVSSFILGIVQFEGTFRGVIAIFLAALICWPMERLYTKLVQAKLKKGGYLEEPGIVLGYVHAIAKELKMGENLTVLLKEEEFAKDPEVVMETKHVQIPFDEPMVVVQTDRMGNKFYLSSDGPELMIDIVRNK